MTPRHPVRRQLCLILPTLACAAAAVSGCAGEEPAQGASPTPARAIAQLEHVVRQRVDSGRSKGIVAGLVLPDGRTRIVAYGDAGGGRRVDADSVFEIGSITKTLTGTLLAQAVQAGEVALDEPVFKLLPAGVTVPARGDRQITLEQLATHTSGLPREPVYAAPGVAGRARYRVGDLYTFLAGHTLAGDPGDAWSYSNLGVGLLGHALARHAHRSYEALVHGRILAPLGMHRTAITPTAQMRPHLAVGHDGGGITPRWSSPALPGGGAERSTIGDMLRFAAANLRSGGDALHRAMAQARSAHTMHNVGLGWERGNHGIVFKAGSTWGFSSFVGLDPARQTAIVLLSNSHASVDDIGFHALDSSRPLTPVRREIRLAAPLLDRYAGAYELEGTTVTIRRVANSLRVAAPGQPAARLYAATKTRFTARNDDAQVDFRLSAGGAVTGAHVRLSEQEFTATRVPGHG